MRARGSPTGAVLLILILWAVLLHVLVTVSAGPLWRDEAWSAAQARLGSWAEVWRSLSWDTFPLLHATVLRLLAIGGLPDSDSALRHVGLITGIAVLALVTVAARRFGHGAVAVVLASTALNPLMIADSTSVRPYGFALAGLAALWMLLMRCLESPSRARLAGASIAAVAAVQASYTNSIHVGALCLAGALVGARTTGVRRGVLLFVPGAFAAASLLPYAPVISRAGTWTSILKFRPDWGGLARGAAVDLGWPLVVMTIVVILAPAATWVALRGRSGAASPAVAFACTGAALSLLAQLALVYAAQLPLFPRYFLPCLLLAGLALASMAPALPSRVALAAAVTIALIAAWPAWSYLRQRRSNADLVAQTLARAASQSDLVLVSPWFLHPSFSRYYRGDASWLAVPDVGQGPGVRYDRIRELMTGARQEQDLSELIRGTAARGGRLWLVSQQYPDSTTAPARPRLADGSSLDGSVYFSFRSYWEREVAYRLNRECAGSFVPVPASVQVWREEKLLLSVWKPGESRR